MLTNYGQANASSPPPNQPSRKAGVIIAVSVMIILALIIVGVALVMNQSSSDNNSAAGTSTSSSASPTSTQPTSEVKPGDAPEQSASVDNADKPTKVTIKTASGESKTFPVIDAVAWKGIDSCGPGQVTFYGNLAPANSHAMGPVQNFKSAKEGMDHMVRKTCFDPTWVCPAVAFNNDEATVDTVKAEECAREVIASKNKWAEKVNEFSNNIKFITLVNIDEEYSSLGMVPAANVNDPPTLTQWGHQPVMGQTIAVVLKNGETRLYRVSCDLQMSVLKFTKAPVKIAPPPTHTGGCVGSGCGTTIVTPPPPPPPPPVCDHCTPTTTTPPPPPPPTLETKVPDYAPGCSQSIGNGGPGGCQPGPGPKTQTPRTTAPSVYTPPPAPPETTVAPAPQVTVTSIPPSAQPTVAPSTQPEVTEEITGCTPEIC